VRSSSRNRSISNMRSRRYRRGVTLMLCWVGPSSVRV
jgi:hypothetical protein